MALVASIEQVPVGTQPTSWRRIREWTGRGGRVRKWAPRVEAYPAALRGGVLLAARTAARGTNVTAYSLLPGPRRLGQPDM